MQGKKTFNAYCDWIDTFDELDDDQAGKLIKHLLRYVNDLNPVPPDQLTKLLFAPIKNTLKRDLQKWLLVCERNRKNGQKGGRKPGEPKQTQTNPLGSSGPQSNPNEPDKDRDRDKEKEVIKPVFSFSKALIEKGFDKYLVEDYLKNRKAKKLPNTKTAFEGFIREMEKTNHDPNELFRHIVESGWGAFKASWQVKLNGHEQPKRRWA